MTPIFVRLVQCLYQNQRTQFRRITFICHRYTKLAPVSLDARSSPFTSNIALRNASIS